ncbi:helix-turn-helix domain-containing protein [Maribacter algarum]|uniref:Helix-turn-helix domain-containing protein n=1 Tax=Maribacter algarum (ex Zhang et al. 2020) TaxID=2578118 RepID=A0A5S3PV28_9FLAO|nr:helix-turn-helix domain-containing protein [Maribacter algarum]TMM58866.1 helix-turn-helix domain-containing protein [Maribacter algarum]
MSWNVFNILILVSSSLIIFISIFKLVRLEYNRTMVYLRWFTILANLVIIQVILIDIGLTNRFPWLLLLYIPFQFLSPVLFTAFTFSYLGRMDAFKKNRLLLLLPFTTFLLLYTLFKVNVFFDYAFLSKQTVAFIVAEIDENLAVGFSLLLGIWNYRTIHNYERSFGNLPYQIVMKKTNWLKGIYVTLVVLCLLWVSTILYLKINANASGHSYYYPLWIFFISFYYCFCFLGTKHLRKVSLKKSAEKASLHTVAQELGIQGLGTLFTPNELEAIEGSQFETTAILGYFATSLFDKNNTKDILWDIVGNCISKLNLEDCVIYSIDSERKKLIQKAAYGNKNIGERKILSPIEIPIGKGIVGTVAQTLNSELINDLSKDPRYIEDDLPRKSELAVPIIYEDKVFGVLDSEHSVKGFFQERHLFLFQLIAKLTATKLGLLSRKSTAEITDDNAYYKQLCLLLEKGKIYQNPELSLTAVAEKLNISGPYLSQLVNKLSNSNFSDFINSYRIRDAEYMLTDSDFTGYTNVAIGLEAGFNSKSAFYSSFKKHTGLTPSEYREKRLLVS